MANKWNTVIFDMDGTTLNTLDDLVDSINTVLYQYGYPKRATMEIRSFLGNGAARLMELSIPGGLDNPKFEQCLQDFKSHYKENMQNRTAPYAGILELLMKLQQQGFKLGIVSNKFDLAVKELSQNYFEGYMSVAIGETNKVKKKPAPDSVFEALKQLESTVEEAVYVGDSEVDVQTAKSAGLPCIGVTWGFRDKRVLEQEGADYIIDTPEELLEILNSNNDKVE